MHALRQRKAEVQGGITIHELAVVFQVGDDLWGCEHHKAPSELCLFCLHSMSQCRHSASDMHTFAYLPFKACCA